MKKMFLFGMIGGLISGFIILLIISFEVYSSIAAEWLSVLGTVGAVVFSLWIVMREEKLNITPYLHTPHPFPPTYVDEYMRNLSDESGEMASTSDDFTLLCIANKMKSNVQVKVKMIRIIDVIAKKENREIKGIVEISHGDDHYNTGYIVLPSGEISPLLIINTNIFYGDSMRFEIQVTLDFIDRGEKTIVICSRGGGLNISPNRSVPVPLG